MIDSGMAQRGLARRPCRGIVLVVCLAALAGPAPAVADIGYAGQFGGSGTGAGQFTNVASLTLDPAGDVYVVDGDNVSTARVQKFGPDGAFKATFGSWGSDPGEFWTAGVAAASPSEILVVDFFNDQVERFTSGTPFTTYTWASAWPLTGYTNPGAAAMAPDGTVYVVDTFNSSIQRFSTTGTSIGSAFGTFGSGDGQFQQPYDVTVGSDGTVYVVDSSNNRIQRFNASGTYLGKWGTPGSGDGQFDSPRGVATDSAGNVYVADNENHRIQKFSAAGNFIARFGSEGAGDGQVSNPWDIAVDSSGTIFVLDRGNSRVQKFKEGGAPISDVPVHPTLPSTPGGTGPTTNKPKTKKSGHWTRIPRGPGCDAPVGGFCYVEVEIPEPGDLTATTPRPGAAAAAKRKRARPGIRSVKRRFTKPGRVRVKLYLNKPGNSVLRRKGKVKVRVRLTFKPKVGETVSTTRTFTYKKKRKKR